MNPQGTSFIPQRPAQGVVKKRGVRKIYILTYVSYVLFFGSALAAVGTFFYDSILDKQLQTQKANLVAEKDRFSQADIDSVLDLNEKISTAERRMDLHLSVLAIFEALETSVSQSLQLDSFSYKRDGAPLVEVSGTAKVFNSLMFQRDILASNPILSGGSFAEVSLASTPPVDEATGEVIVDKVETEIAFGLAKKVEPSLIAYRPRYTQDVRFTENVTSDFSGAPTEGEDN